MSHAAVPAVQFPKDAVDQVLNLGSAHALLDPRVEVDGTQDWLMRQAEFWNVIEIAREAAGRRFKSLEAARDELFAYAPGGGFGIRNFVIDEMLELMQPVGAVAPTSPIPIPLEAQAKLGAYVYALKDPRDGSVFYVGKGRGNRVFSHVWEAMGIAAPSDNLEKVGSEKDSKAVTSAKIQRIRAIHDSGFGIEHWIIRHQIDGDALPDKEAYAIEQALIDGLELAAPKGLTNIAGGHIRTAHNVARVEELVRQYSAEPVPPLPSPCALVKVNAAVDPDANPEQIYEWSRRAWRVGPGSRNEPNLPILVFAADIVRAVHRVNSWGHVFDQRGKVIPRVWEYAGAPDAELETRYVGKSLREVRAARSTGGWRQHGWHPYL